MTDRQADRERVAIAATERIKAVVGDGAWYGTAMRKRESNDKPLDMRVDACKIMYELLASTEAAVLKEAATYLEKVATLYGNDGYRERGALNDCAEAFRQQAQERKP